MSLLALLRRLLQRFISPDELRPGDTLVWDTSSLSHAFEDYVHAIASAYRDTRKPRTWDKVKRSFMRRVDSEMLSRRLLVSCDTYHCVMPPGVYSELSRVPRFRDSLRLVAGDAKYVERLYAGGRGEIEGFATTYNAYIMVEKPSTETVNYVLTVAATEGYNINEIDAEGIALALEKNAVLVTSDKRQAMLADRLGLRVLYTIGKPVHSKTRYVQP